MRILPGITAILAMNWMAGAAEPSDLSKVMNRYRVAKGVSMNVKKRTYNDLIGKEKLSEGRLFYAKGRVRMEVRKPEESLLVMDGKTLWFANTLPAEMGGKTMVAKTKGSNLRKTNSVMAALFDDRRILQQFRIKDEKRDSRGTQFTLVPKSQEATEVTKLEILAGQDRLLRVKYWDDRENETTIEMSDTDFTAKIPEQSFKYTPPKGAEITEY